VLKRLCVAALFFVVGTTTARASDVRQAVDAWRAAHEASIIAGLESLTRLRSVAADPQGLTAAAQALSAQLAARDFSVRVLSAGKGAPPLLYAERLQDGATRTVIFYAHYDGQPVTPSDWSSDPFVPVLRAGARLSDPVVAVTPKTAFDPEWRLYGRAVSDDKASIIAFLAAYDALKAAGIAPSVNIKVVWEGEEEAGSPHLQAVLEANKALFAGDLWLIGDGPAHQSRRPTLYFGARGSMGLEMTLYGPVRALHDGHYGNWVPNPAAMAANLLAAMRDDEGRILIPGFYDDVRPLTAAEKTAIAALPAVEPGLKTAFGIGRTEGQSGLYDSLMRPALNVRGLRAGGVGAAAANAIPTTATVSMDFRLVPGQTPERVRAQVEAFLAGKGWTLVTHDPDAADRGAAARLVRLDWEAGYPALRSDMTSPAGRAVIAAAQKASAGSLAVIPMMGGSVPIYLFDTLFHEPVVGLPIANHDNSQHAANENLRLRNLWDGIDVYAAMMADLRW